MDNPSRFVEHKSVPRDHLCAPPGWRVPDMDRLAGKFLSDVIAAPPGSAPSPTVQRIARRASCGPSRPPIAFRHASGCATAYANRTTGRRQTSRKKGSGSHRWSRPSIRTPDNDSVGAAIFQAGRRAQFRHPATGYACTTHWSTSASECHRDLQRNCPRGVGSFGGHGPLLHDQEAAMAAVPNSSDCQRHVKTDPLTSPEI